MKYLIEREYAKIQKSAEAVYREIQTTTCYDYDTSDIFKPNVIENILEELESIREGEN